MIVNALFVGAGGFVGVLLRYLISLIPVGNDMVFPIKTFVINMIGCIAIGCIAVILIKGTGSDHLELFLKVGVCGGFTTFSTFALETSGLIRSGNIMIAIAYVLLSVIVGVGVIMMIELMK